MPDSETVSPVPGLFAGNFYWIRQKYERIWRPCYAFEDDSENLWIHIISFPPIMVSTMDLTYFDILDLPRPVE